MIKDKTALRIYQAEWQGKNSFPGCDILGGVPLVYETSFGRLVCSDCANDIADCDIEHITAVIPYYEGNPVSCDECGVGIESLYGGGDDD